MRSREIRQGDIYKGYKIEAEVGAGGFAKVFRAQINNQEVAFKVLNNDATPDQVKIFMHEASMLNRLEHKHIVPYIGSDIDPNTEIKYIVMAYTPNKTLEDRLEKIGIMTPPDTLKYVDQAAQALQYTHGEQIIHGDVKPGNMLLNDHFDIWLTDFGIAVLAHQVPTKERLGSPNYVAREQYNKEPKYASDQFSLGVTAYELLTGKFPFIYPGNIDQTTKPVPFAKQVQRVTAVLAELEKVIKIALEKEPDKRYPDVVTFAKTLQAAYDAVLAGKPLDPGSIYPGAKLNIQPIPNPIIPPLPTPQPIAHNPIVIPPSPVLLPNPVQPNPHQRQQAINLPPSPIVPPQPKNPSRFHISRRNFLKGAAALGLGLAGFYIAKETIFNPVVYDSDGSGFADWRGTREWKVKNGVLINDGSAPYKPEGSATPSILAPVDVRNISNYAVEASIKLTPDIKPTASIGFVVRYTPGGIGYVIFFSLIPDSLAHNSTDKVSVSMNTVGSPDFTEVPQDHVSIDTVANSVPFPITVSKEHLYRVEIQNVSPADDPTHYGNSTGLEVNALVDGNLLSKFSVDSAIWNYGASPIYFASGSSVGFIDEELPLTVENFKVIKL